MRRAPDSWSNLYNGEFSQLIMFSFSDVASFLTYLLEYFKDKMESTEIPKKGYYFSAKALEISHKDVFFYKFIILFF